MLLLYQEDVIVSALAEHAVHGLGNRGTDVRSAAPSMVMERGPCFGQRRVPSRRATAPA